MMHPLSTLAGHHPHIVVALSVYQSPYTSLSPSRSAM